MLFAEDNDLGDSRDRVYQRLMKRSHDWNHPKAQKAMIEQISTEMQQTPEDVRALIDLFQDTDGKDQNGVTEAVRRYRALLPSV